MSTAVRSTVPRNDRGPRPDQAAMLRARLAEVATPAPWTPAVRRCRAIAVAGGKGGAGKSVTAWNMAMALAAEGRRVCLVDAVPGLGHLPILCGVAPQYTLSDWIAGGVRLSEAAFATEFGPTILPGAEAILELTTTTLINSRVADRIELLDRYFSRFDVAIVDCGGVTSASAQTWLSIAELVIAITTPEATAIADAYASLKVLSSMGRPPLGIVVNQAADRAAAANIADRITSAARAHLRQPVASPGWIPFDPLAAASVQRRRPLFADHPRAPAAAAWNQLAWSCWEQLHALPPPRETMCRPWIERFESSPSIDTHT